MSQKLKSKVVRKKHSQDFEELTIYIGGYTERKGFKTTWANMPEKLLLVHSEVSEATEALRHDDMKNFKEEIADTFVRLFDICHHTGINVYDEVMKKMEYNETRPYRHGGKFCVHYGMDHIRNKIQEMKDKIPTKVESVKEICPVCSRGTMKDLKSQRYPTWSCTHCHTVFWMENGTLNCN